MHRHPKERIDSIIEDSNAGFVITEGEFLNTYENTIDVNELLSGNDDKRPNVDVTLDDLAYLIYTSGYTGKPKGVMLRHIGICSYLTYSDSNIQLRKLLIIVVLMVQLQLFPLICNLKKHYFHYVTVLLLYLQVVKKRLTLLHWQICLKKIMLMHLTQHHQDYYNS